jgi:hypothetical protein
MTWNPLEQPQDYALLGGQRTPGLCDLRDADSPRRIDERRGYGLSGATAIYRGIALSNFKMLLRLYTVDDWEAWHTFSPTVQRPPSGQRARALDISHPLTEELGIRSVMVENVKQPTQTGDGEWTIEISLKEYRRPVRQLVRLEGSQASNDPVDRTIEALSGIVQAGGEGDVAQALAPILGGG